MHIVGEYAHVVVQLKLPVQHLEAGHVDLAGDRSEEGSQRVDALEAAASHGSKVGQIVGKELGIGGRITVVSAAHCSAELSEKFLLDALLGGGSHVRTSADSIRMSGVRRTPRSTARGRLKRRAEALLQLHFKEPKCDGF
jgi:hypothetical protein